ncbi:MAG: hypothetical protein E7585_00885 [Ruminococcaceae bacterium]|nr:hypothetical protein [Oscillospiraceae bacterium]
MQKLIKNWIFTLITCVLLVVLALVLVLDLNGVFGEKYYATTFVNLLAAVALIIYIAIGLAPMVAYYRGKALAFLLAEMGILVIVILALLGVEFFGLFSKWDMQVVSVLGLALWLRCTVLIIRAYLQQTLPQSLPEEQAPVEAPVQEQTEAVAQAAPQDEKEEAKLARRAAREKKKNAQIPLWMLCVAILLSAVGIWQLAAPSPELSDTVFAYCIAGLATVFAVLFAILTVQNHRALPPKTAKEEEDTNENGDAEVEALPEEKEPAGELPAAKEEQAEELPEKPEKEETAPADTKE